MTSNETVTQRLVGNGLVIARTEKPGARVPWHWISDEHRVSKAHSQTYRHRETLKAYGCRWSKKRRQWYFIGANLPDEIVALVGPRNAVDEPDKLDEQVQLAAVLRQFAESFQADLARLMNTPALPAVATICLDDPWA